MHYFKQAFAYEYASSFYSFGRVLTFFSPSHPWSNVIIGLGYKYPNPHCSHVLCVDVVDRSVDPTTGVVRTERILGCKQKTPAWILKVGACVLVCSKPGLKTGRVDLWRLRRCFRPRSVLRRSSHAKMHDHFRQLVPQSDRNLLRADSIHTVVIPP